MICSPGVLHARPSNSSSSLFLSFSPPLSLLLGRASLLLPPLWLGSRFARSHPRNRSHRFFRFEQRRVGFSTLSGCASCPLRLRAGYNLAKYPIYLFLSFPTYIRVRVKGSSGLACTETWRKRERAKRGTRRETQSIGLPFVKQTMYLRSVSAIRSESSTAQNSQIEQLRCSCDVSNRDRTRWIRGAFSEEKGLILPGIIRHDRFI